MLLCCSSFVLPQSHLDSAVGLVGSIAEDLAGLDREIQGLRENLMNAENNLRKSAQSQQDLELILSGKEQLLESLDELLQRREMTLDLLSARLDEQQRQFQKSRQKYRFWLIALGVLSAGLTGSTIGLALSR
jgi:septal ring factor EnvC (AmiA/AmiB activator)